MPHQLVLVYEEVTREELPAEEKALLEAAELAAGRAYAPYSRFPVGAAARTTDKRIWTGNNQENAAYPSGLCAERTLLFYLGSQQLISAVEAIAVYAPHSSGPVMPCGACRQVMYEYEQLCGRPWLLIFAGAAPVVYRIRGVHTLLPLAFVWKPA